MNRSRFAFEGQRCWGIVTVVAALSLVPSTAKGDDVFTQQIPLTPGWNAVFLQVEPDPSDPESVFAGVPVESVWTWSDRGSSVEFLIDPSEIEWNTPEWLDFRTNPAHRILTDLSAIVANRAYLIKLGGTAAATWSVTGRPSTRRTRWTPDSFNLAGFPLDPGSPTSLGAFLAPSAAHAGQAVFQLNTATGLWQFVDNPFTAPASAGEAYWVYTDGASTFQGPWFLDIAGADGLDFGASLSERLVRITNVSDTPRNVQVRELSSPNPVNVLYKSLDETTATFEWQSLASMPAVSVPAGGTAAVALAVRREGLAVGAEVGSVLEFEDGTGVRYLVPVRAKR